MDKRKSYTQKNYSGIADLYTADFGNDNENFDAYIGKAIQIIQKNDLKEAIVDLGAGPGNVIDFLLAHSVRNPLVAVDFTPEFCSRLEGKYKKNRNIKVICEDFVSYIAKQQDNSISSYIANYSIIHLLDEEVDSFFADIYRSLQSKGVFAFSVWQGTEKGMEKEPYQTQRDERLNVESELESYLNYFTEDELRKRLSVSGLSVVQMQTLEPTFLPGEFPKYKIWVLAEKL